MRRAPADTSRVLAVYLMRPLEGSSSLNATVMMRLPANWATLIAVSATTNRSKGDREPQSWMPAKARCWYVASWVTVKWRWHLKINSAEETYLTKQLTGCGWPKVGRPSRPTIRTSGTSGTTGSKPTSGGPDPRFATCTAAKAAGYGPYYRSRDVEYGWYQDRDRDGVVCE